MKTQCIGRLLSAVCLLVACSSGDNGVAPANQPPTIAFTFTKIGVARSIPIDLTVAVSDPDEDDALDVNWEITRGSLTPQNQNKTTMRWVPPSTVGLDTVVISVTDGTETRSVTETIKVGTQASGAFARPEYIKAQSPYILVATGAPPVVSVDPAQMTTIEAGTEILIDVPASAIHVFGTLQSQGSAANPVIIRPNDRTLRCGENRGWWNGIRGLSDQQSDGQIDLSYTELWYGNSALHLSNKSTASVTSCKIKCSGDEGILVDGFGSLSVSASEITDGRNNGITVASVNNLPDSIFIGGSDISINENSGITLDLVDANQEVRVVISGNLIQFNTRNGIVLANAVFPEIHNNEIVANGLEGVLSNIRLDDGYPGGVPFDTLDATSNYWGAFISNQSSIDATIRDKLDSGSVGTRVKTNPWCNNRECTIFGP